MNGAVPVGLLPYGVFTRTDDDRRRLGVAEGTDVIDLHGAAGTLAGDVDPSLLEATSLDPLLAAGRPAWSAVRAALLDRVAAGDLDEHRIPRAEVTTHLAWHVADFVDFYSSIDHATNVGRMFRPDGEPLLPNWHHLPVGYHGRSGTVVVDGTPIRRPSGQHRGPAGVGFGPSTRLDFEAEMGWVLGGPTCQGVPVDIDAAADHVFGLVLLDDWSARDIQAWEYVPLGPFLGKSFATTVSAWVVSVDALEEARVPSPPQDPAPLPYLTTDQPWAFDIDLEVWMRPSGAPEPTRIASVNAARGLYWTIAQHVAHCTVNGASLRAGDLLGTGTISGPAPAERGSLLELSWNGEEPITIGDQERSFVEDGDEVTLTATFPFAGGRGSLGPASGTVVG